MGGLKLSWSWEFGRDGSVEWGSVEWDGRMYYMNGERVYDMIYDEMR